MLLLESHLPLPGAHSHILTSLVPTCSPCSEEAGQVRLQEGRISHEFHDLLEQLLVLSVSALGLC